MNITIGADSPLNEDFFERLYDLVEKSKKKTTKWQQPEVHAIADTGSTARVPIEVG